MADDDQLTLTLGLDEIFPEPPRSKSPPATLESYTRRSHGDERELRGRQDLRIRLVGQHALWGHQLWNASKCLADFLDENWHGVCNNKRILELGAGGGLPGLVAALNQANSVILTDYPDSELLDNLRINVQINLDASALERTSIQGFVWGSNPANLLRDGPFDLIIMSDLLFNHSQHDALLKTCDQTLLKQNTAEEWTPCVLVFFTHHRPWLAGKDLEFFTKAQATGWQCQQVLKTRMSAMFSSDPGDEEVRATVHGWRMWRVVAS